MLHYSLLCSQLEPLLLSAWKTSQVASLSFSSSFSAAVPLRHFTGRWPFTFFLLFTFFCFLLLFKDQDVLTECFFRTKTDTSCVYTLMCTQERKCLIFNAQCHGVLVSHPVGKGTVFFFEARSVRRYLSGCADSWVTQLDGSAVNSVGMRIQLSRPAGHLWLALWSTLLIARSPTRSPTWFSLVQSFTYKLIHFVSYPPPPDILTHVPVLLTSAPPAVILSFLMYILVSRIRSLWSPPCWLCSAFSLMHIQDFSSITSTLSRSFSEVLF